MAELTESHNIFVIGKRKMKTLCLVMAFLILPGMFLLSQQSDPSIIYHNRILEPSFSTLDNTDEVPSGYLVWNPNCHIPNVDPFSRESMLLFHKKNYKPCSMNQITHLINDEYGNGVLYINTTDIDKPLQHGETLQCCYSNVTRHKDKKYRDLKIEKSNCINFNSSVVLSRTEEFIVVKCERRYKKHVKKVYDEVHVNIQILNSTQERLETVNSNLTKKPWNVLFIGIDTLSRINFARAMPKTNKYLLKNGWLDFQGYNKIDDNTYPNLMAILTGRNQSRSRKVCDGKGNFSQDNCDFMWKKYHNVGYATAYGEDFSPRRLEIDTFGLPNHSGFVEKPTDHYLKPFIIGAEKPIVKGHEQSYCTGHITSGEMVYNYALEFTKKYENHPNFGFFWTNTFSHNFLSTPSSMDEKMKEYMIKFNDLGIMNSTIIFFISDHGIRFGDLRTTLTGYYEERLPALFVWLPQLFKNEFPIAHRNMLVNTKRLTTPYDVYMTLEDILDISGKKTETHTSEACPLCHSLFKPMRWNRTCEEASILSHWCTCDPLLKLPLDHNIANRAIKYVLDVEVEKILNTTITNGCRVCLKLNLSKVQHLYVYKRLKEVDNFIDYMVVFSTTPGDMVFESTVRHFNSTDDFQIQGIVSRLTSYSGEAGCVKTAHLKKYCFCDKKCHK